MRTFFQIMQFQIEWTFGFNGPALPSNTLFIQDCIALFFFGRKYKCYLGNKLGMLTDS